jgi:protein tyrosine kinase modulator
MPNTPEPITLERFWNIVRRRRRAMFVALTVVWLVACALAWFLPPRYMSESTILIEQPQVPEKLVLPNVVLDIQAHLQTLTQEVLSRSRLQRIVDDLHLYSGRLDRLLAGGDVIARMRKDIKVNLVPTTTGLVQANTKSSEVTSFTISYSGSDRQLVQEVTSRLTSLFVEENLRARQQQSETTTQFLDKQLQEARVHLDEQEKQIKEFKARFVGQLPGELQSNLQILGALQARLEQANEGLNRSEQQRLYLSSMLSAYHDTPSLALENGTAKPVDVTTELQRLKSELAEMKSRYTDGHPAVVQIRDEIAKAEQLKAEMEKDKDKGNVPLSRGVAEIQSQLKGNELDIQNRQKEIASLQSKMQVYETRLNETPLREQQLQELSKDYTELRTNYDDLSKKRDASALATNLQKTEQDEQFVVLESPRWPSSPYFPDRLLFTLGGIAAGLAAAFATAFMREAGDDRIHTEGEVSTISKAPILVAIPPLTASSDITTARWRVVAEAACAILAVTMMTTSTLLAYYYG